MTSESIELDDTAARRAVEQLRAAASDLSTPTRDAGQLLLDRATPKTPRRSGRLAASGRVDAVSDEAAVVYDEVYAGVIHNGWPAHNIAAQPWLSQTFSEAASDVVGIYQDHLQAAITT